VPENAGDKIMVEYESSVQMVLASYINRGPDLLCARFFTSNLEGFDRQVQTQMYAHIHAEKPLKRFVSIGDDRFVAEAVDGSVVLTATGDYVLWTENLDELMQYKNNRITELGLDGKRHLWPLGSVSENGQDGLDNLGWGVRPNLVNDYLDTQCNPAVPAVTLEAE